MAMAKMDTVIRHLRRVVMRQDGAGWTDGQLLASFIDHKDEAAFEALVRRHGPMVFGVCRRLLHNYHDAEDAFQATFLVLARKASSVRPRERVANWLHGVALRTALKAKAMTAKRREREKLVTEIPEPEAAQQDQWSDLQPLLDRELNGLPERYRLPILLCDLEGKTIKDAAQQLGWPQGTLAGRLARGRKLLAKRLANRGVALSAGSLAAVVSQNAVSAAVPTSLISSTVKAAIMIASGQAAVAGVVPAQVAALTEGVMKAMLLTKLKTVVAVPLVVALALAGGAGVIYQTQAAGQLNAQQGDQPPKSEQAGLVGVWKAVSLEVQGNRQETDALLTKQPVKAIKWTFADNKLKIRGGDEIIEASYKVAPSANPKKIDLTFLVRDGDLEVEATALGIYSLEGDTLQVCFFLHPTVITRPMRPLRFDLKGVVGTTCFTFRREGKPQPEEGIGNAEKTDQAAKQGDENNKQPVVARNSGAKLDTAKTDLDRLQGIWSAVWIENGGERSRRNKLVFMVDGKRACLQGRGVEMKGGLYLEPTAKPKTFDLAMSERTIAGIYSLEGDTLRLCYGGVGRDEPKRPDGFHAEGGDQQVLILLKRMYGPEMFPFRLADGTRAFPTIINSEGEIDIDPPPPSIAPQPKANKPGIRYGGYNDPGGPPLIPPQPKDNKP